MLSSLMRRFFGIVPLHVNREHQVAYLQTASALISSLGAVSPTKAYQARMRTMLPSAHGRVWFAFCLGHAPGARAFERTRGGGRCNHGATLEGAIGALCDEYGCRMSICGVQDSLAWGDRQIRC